MPFVRFRGFEKQDLEQLSPYLVEEFATIAEIPMEIVKVELLHAEQLTNNPPLVEISMFQRDQSTHDAIAAMIYRLVNNYGYKNAHIFFVILQPGLYYKEGVALNEIPKVVYSKS
ncbi:DUF1904 family protein [Halalkalibacter krulwichiae]|uniref:Tautomerase enzyme n=1 Tax=Halalkalibacter krulwichiae TaxID=199441 RepID=A0A1X9M858_9BACI|nr:DUF1904 family protein [Halalkalibacter krulwichiae]ARK29625.1 hypothetical protein BkAM31D_06980 [Halalkalibacter krulwichiae]